MKIAEGPRVEIQQALGHEIPEPSAPGFAAFYSRLELEHPELASKLAAALEDDAPLDADAKPLFPEQEAQARTRERARSILQRVFYRQDELTDEWKLSKGKVGIAALGTAFALIVPLTILPGGSRAAANPGGQTAQKTEAAPATPAAPETAAAALPSPPGAVDPAATASAPDTPPPAVAPTPAAEVAPAPPPVYDPPPAYNPPPSDPPVTPPRALPVPDEPVPTPPPYDPPSDPPAPSVVRVAPPVPSAPSTPGGTVYSAPRAAERASSAVMYRGAAGAAAAPERTDPILMRAAEAPPRAPAASGQVLYRAPEPEPELPEAPAPEPRPDAPTGPDAAGAVVERVAQERAPAPPATTILARPDAAPARPSAPPASVILVRPAGTPQGAAGAAGVPAAPAAETPAGPTLAIGGTYGAVLETGVIVPEGAQNVPVVARTGEGIVLVGAASLDAARRLNIDFAEALVNGRRVPLRARAYDPAGLPGIAVQTRDVAPSLANDLLRATASGVTQYVTDLNQRGQVTLLSGGAAVASRSEGATLGQSVLGAVTNLFSVPPTQKALVRIAQLDRGLAFSIVVLDLGGR